MIKIIVTGAECSGKSTLAKTIANRYDIPLLSEYARTYLSSINRSYKYEDIESIAREHQSQELPLLKAGHKAIVYDTSYLVLKIWSEYKYGQCCTFIQQAFRSQHTDLYILPDCNIPYEYDPLREHPQHRDILYHLYLDTLTQLKLPYIQVSGSTEERMLIIKKSLDPWLSQ